MNPGSDSSKCSWQCITAAKRKENIAKIPPEWLLSESVLAAAEQSKNIAGEFIEGLLDETMLSITSADNERILELIRNGSLTAVQVTTAFCKTGEYAHQLVPKPFLYYE